MSKWVEFRDEGRAPHGARGLKLRRKARQPHDDGSRPAWGAWIETPVSTLERKKGEVAPRMGRVD